SFTDRVQITWSGNSGNFFRVYRNTTNSSTTATAGVTYYYFVRAASNSSGSNISAFSTSNAGYRNSAPVVTTPTGVLASDGSFTDRVQVSWSGTSGNFFRVYRNTTNSTTNASVISNWQNNQFFIDDFSALAGTTYFYFIQAASSSAGANAGAFSVINSGWRSVAPVVSVPTSVNASDGTYSDKVSVTWAGTSGNYFRVIRNTSNSTSVGTVINNWQNTQLYFDDLSAVAGTTYYYFVQAASSSAGANPSSYSVINSGWRSVAPVVSVPSSVTASDGSFTDRVQVTWSGTSGNFFRVYRNTTNSSSTATALGSWQTSFSYDDYNATAGVTYYYFVRAASNSSGSNISSFSTSNSGYRSTSCGTPTGLQTSQVTSTTCFLNWNAVSGATQYSLWYHNGSSWIQFGTISQNSTYITNMVAGSQYCLAVKAICGGVSGNLSAYVCLIPGFNGGGNNTQSLTTDVNHIPSAPEVTVSDMSVFPNPAIQGSEINLQYSAPTETQAKIIVYDVSGKIFSQLNINIDAGENVINMQAPENAGLYICRMIFQNGSLLQTKLIVH
ncbi:MAG: T9SS type A sorting domain-containing protein, partial [Saprospiraceae bacterium]